MFFRSFLLVTLGLLSTSTTYAHHGDGKKLNDVNNEVTVKLLQTLTEDDNALFSSALLSSELLLLANGVSGPAKDELLKAVGLKDQGNFLPNKLLKLNLLFIFFRRPHPREPRREGGVDPPRPPPFK